MYSIHRMIVNETLTEYGDYNWMIVNHLIKGRWRAAKHSDRECSLQLLYLVLRHVLLRLIFQGNQSSGLVELDDLLRLLQPFLHVKHSSFLDDSIAIHEYFIISSQRNKCSIKKKKYKISKALCLHSIIKHYKYKNIIMDCG